MKKIFPLVVIISLLTLTVFTAYGQGKDADKPKTTADAWRTAIPAAEEQPTAPVIEDPTFSEVVETPADVEKKVIVLEKQLMEALKTRDSATLKNLLADDFLLAGVTIAGTKSDKLRYIDWAVKNLDLKAFAFERTVVRAFPTTAVVTYDYKRQATIGDAPSDGIFTVTDVWMKRGERWVVMSHHISPSPKP